MKGFTPTNPWKKKSRPVNPPKTENSLFWNPALKRVARTQKQQAPAFFQFLCGLELHKITNRSPDVWTPVLPKIWGKLPNLGQTEQWSKPTRAPFHYTIYTGWFNRDVENGLLRSFKIPVLLSSIITYRTQPTRVLIPQLCFVPFCKNLLWCFVRISPVNHM